MRSIKLLFIIILCFIALCGCTKRQITSVADEVTAYTWENSDKFNKNIKLSFNDNYAKLYIKTNNYTGQIQGNAVVTNNSIEIFDNTLKESYKFSYTLYGDRIEFTYGEKTIKLEKSNMQIE